MRDFAFYNVAENPAPGPHRVVVWLRRGVRRLLRPIFLRQVEIYRYFSELLDEHDQRITAQRLVDEQLAGQIAAQSARQDELDQRLDALSQRIDAVARRQDELSEHLHTIAAFGWDFVAMGRRLGAIEDQIAVLTGSPALAGDESEAHPSILFPGLEKIARSPDRDDDLEVRARVS
jgi:hypothetical protein